MEKALAQVTAERNAEMQGNREAVAVADAMGERAIKAENERDEARSLAAQVSVDREAAWSAAAKNGRERDVAREGARGLGVTCQAAEQARDMYQQRAEAAEAKLARVMADRDEWRRRADVAEGALAAIEQSIYRAKADR